MTLEQYCQDRGIPLSFQQQDLRYYLTVQGSGAQDSGLDYLVQSEYPGVQLEEYQLNYKVYCLGTVFDLIQNSGSATQI